jgi:hypothetical protein
MEQTPLQLSLIWNSSRLRARSRNLVIDSRALVEAAIILMDEAVTACARNAEARRRALHRRASRGAGN